MPDDLIRIPMRVPAGTPPGCPVVARLPRMAAGVDLLGPEAEPEWGRLSLQAEGADLPCDARLTEDGQLELGWVSGPREVSLVLRETPHDAPFPRVQALPQPGHRIELTIDGAPALAYHYQPPEGKPFCHPFVGPDGALTRMGDPHDLEGRWHNHAIWLGHRDVDGLNFWDDAPGQGRQCHHGVRRLVDGPVSAEVEAVVDWVGPGERLVLAETLALRLWALGEARALDLTVRLAAVEEPVRLGRTPFGLLGVRVARGLAPRGGGRLWASTGQAGEAGVMHTRARWCACSGLVAPGRRNGLAVFDHEANPHHPCYWHARDDGWLGASLAYDQGLVLEPGEDVTLRYRLLAWRDAGDDAGLDEQYEAYLRTPEVSVGEPTRIRTDER